MARVANASSEILEVSLEATRLSLGPSPRLLHSPPDVRSPLGSAGIAGEVVVFKGTFNLVLAHAIGICGDTECYISSGGPGLVLDRSSEAL
jgi:hypothetical protein